MIIGLPAWVLLGFIVSALIIGFIDEIARVTGLVPSGAIDGSLRNTLIAGLVYVLALAIVIGVPYKWRQIKTTKEELGFTRLPNWTDMLLAPASFLLYMLAAGILLSIVTSLMPAFDAEEAQEVGFEGINQYYEYALAFITLVVLAIVAVLVFTGFTGLGLPPVVLLVVLVLLAAASLVTVIQRILAVYRQTQVEA